MKYIPHFWIELRYRIQSVLFTPVEYFADPFFLSTLLNRDNFGYRPESVGPYVRGVQNWNSKKFSFFSLSFFFSLYLLFSIRPFPFSFDHFYPVGRARSKNAIKVLDTTGGRGTKEINLFSDHQAFSSIHYTNFPFSNQTQFDSKFVPSIRAHTSRAIQDDTHFGAMSLVESCTVVQSSSHARVEHADVLSAKAEDRTSVGNAPNNNTSVLAFFENVGLEFKPNWNDRLETTNLPFFGSFRSGNARKLFTDSRTDAPSRSTADKVVLSAKAEGSNRTKLFQFLTVHELNKTPISSPLFHIQLGRDMYSQPTRTDSQSEQISLVGNQKYVVEKGPTKVVYGLSAKAEVLSAKAEVLSAKAEEPADTIQLGTTKKYIGSNIYKIFNTVPNQEDIRTDNLFFRLIEKNKKNFDSIEEESTFEKPSEKDWENFKKLYQRFTPGTTKLSRVQSGEGNYRTMGENGFGKLFSSQQRHGKFDFDTVEFMLSQPIPDFLLGQEEISFHDQTNVLHQASALAKSTSPSAAGRAAGSAVRSANQESTNKFEKNNQKVTKDYFFLTSKELKNEFTESLFADALPFAHARAERFDFFNTNWPFFESFSKRSARALRFGGEHLSVRAKYQDRTKVQTESTKHQQTGSAEHLGALGSLNFVDSLSFHIVSVDPGAFSRSFVSLRAPFSLIGSFFLFSLSFSFFKIRGFFDSLIQNLKNQDGTTGNGTNVDVQIIFPTQLIPTLGDFTHVGLNMSLVQKTLRSFQIYSSQIFFIRIFGFCCFQYYAFSQQQIFLWSSFFFGILSYDFTHFKNLLQTFWTSFSRKSKAIRDVTHGQSPRMISVDSSFPQRKRSARACKVEGSLPKAFLLSGVSGTGKSYFFQALTREAKCLGIRASFNSVLTAISESKFFQPCIVFLDHIDSVGRKREKPFGFQANTDSKKSLYQKIDFCSENGEVLSRASEDIFDIEKVNVLPPSEFTFRTSDLADQQKNSEKNKKQLLPAQRNNTLLSLLVYLDGSARNSDSNILLGSTLCADNLDAAFLRPGRFDMILHFSYPEKNDRIQILKLQTAVQPWTVVSPLVSWNFLSTLTQSFSPADLNLLVQNSESTSRNVRLTAYAHTMLSLMKNICLFVQRKSLSFEPSARYQAY